VDFGVTRATTAYRTNASGVLESVASGVPRLDYPALGGCPSLLVEPAATNLFLRSEEFDDASWTKFGGVVSANTETSPDGAINSDTLQGDGSSVQIIISQGKTLSAGQFTSSIFAKAGTANFLELTFDNFAGASNISGIFDLSNGTTSSVGANIQSFNNGWYKCSLTSTIVSGDVIGSLGFRIRPNAANLFYPNAAATNGQNVYLWGAQIEAGSVATSYIPTVAATATRNADVISKSGVSGFIGQTEGVIYAEVDLRNTALPKALLTISDGTLNNRINISFASTTSLTVTLRVASANLDYGVTIPTIPTSGGIYKVALAYQANNYALALNGTTYIPTSPASVPATSAVYLGQNGGSGNIINDRIRAAAIYPTRLTNAQLASLTTL